MTGARWRIALAARPGAAPLGAIFGALGLGLGAVAALLHLDRLPFTICYFKAFTGWPCLTCGTTRAVVRLFALDLRGALAMNPLATLGTLALIPWAAADLVLWTRGRAVVAEVAPRSARVLRVVVVTAVLVNWGYLLAVGR